MKQCRQCTQQFEITDMDRAFYATMNVPAPTWCPQCRAQRRLAFRNERTFYRAICARCSKSIVSQFAPDSKLVVYCSDCYWSDEWQGQDYGVDFDFSKTFTEQFDTLNRRVPHMAMIHANSINCNYTHLAADNKDCYMLIESSNNENCIHSYWMQVSRDCIDTSFTHEGQLMAESDCCAFCYKLLYSRNCEKCTDSFFLLNCNNCTNCFGCVNLRNKQYCVFNEQKTREEYEAFVQSLRLDTWSGIQEARKQVEVFVLGQPRKYAEIFASENSTGNYLHRTRNCVSCFDGYDAENCSYGEHVWRNAKDCMDVSTAGRDTELVYEGINCGIKDYMIRFGNQCWSCSYNDYCAYCNNLSNGFGCVAVKKGDYCIFNKSYDKESYEIVREKIIAHMKKTGEWGEYFHPSLSLFGYNETVAQEYYPLTKEAALDSGFNWNDTASGTYGKETISWDAILDSINDVPDDIVKEVLACIDCKKNYKIITQELPFYRNLCMPIPRRCPDCRHVARMKSRGGNILYARQCVCDHAEHGHAERCPTRFETTYAPDRPEIVYCESCYQKEVV